MTTLQVAAADPAAALLRGAVVPGAVLAVHARAALVVLPDDRTISLLTPAASGPPNGVLIPDRPGTPAAALIGGLRPGMPATVGGGVLAVGGHRLAPVRSWRTLVLPTRLHPSAPAAMAEAADAAGCGLPAAALAKLRRSLEAGERVDAGALVGLGAGSTPAGDDVLAGLLIGLRAASERCALAWLAQALSRLDLPALTTALSADLLRLAAEGHAAVEAMGVLTAGGGGGRALHRAIRKLLAVGGTSGADLLTGMALAFRVKALRHNDSGRWPGQQLGQGAGR